MLARASGVGPPAARGRIAAVDRAGGLSRITVSVGGRDIEVHDLVRRGWRVDDEVSVSLADGAAMVRAAERRRQLAPRVSLP